MGRVTPNNDKLSRTYSAVNRLTKLAKGEKARLILIELGLNSDGTEGGAWCEWRHNLQAPEVKEGDTVIRERNWLGTYRCLGRPEVLAQNKRDPDNCPACQLADRSDEFAPKPYYAMNVIRYGTKAGSFELAMPYNVQVLVWRFSENVYSQIIDKMGMYREGDKPVDLRMHDLFITCENPQFQNYELDLAPAAAWLAKEHNKARAAVKLRDLVAETYRENRYDDEVLADEIAFKAAPATLADKSAQLAAALGIAASPDTPNIAPTPQAAPPRMSPEELANTIGGGAPEPATAPPAAPVEEEVPSMDLDAALAALGDDDSEDTPTAPAADAPAEAPAPEPDEPAAYDAAALDAILGDV